jgi:hypothetical protein
MPRSLALAVVVVLALPAVARANPSISVSASRLGSTRHLPAKVQHRLTLTAGLTPERVTVDVTPPSHISVTGAAVTRPTSGTGPSLASCPGRWTRFHMPYRTQNFPTEVTLSIAAGQTATLTTVVELVHAPWPDETLDATWSIEPALGRAFEVVSNAPLYGGPLGVQLAFRVVRAVDGDYVVSGTAEPDVNSGHVELWAFPPGRDHARRVARLRVRHGAWSYNRFRPTRRGRWELYARYRTAGHTFANDASECGTFARVR